MSPSKIHSGTVPMAQQEMSLCQRIGTAAFPPKAIGMAVGSGFRDGIETQQVECLHGPIGHRGDTHSTLPPHPNRLRDSSPSPIPIIPFGASASRSFVFAAGIDPDLIVVLPDGRHAAIALSSTDYAPPLEGSPPRRRAPARPRWLASGHPTARSPGPTGARPVDLAIATGRNRPNRGSITSPDPHGGYLD